MQDNPEQGQGGTSEASQVQAPVAGPEVPKSGGFFSWAKNVIAPGRGSAHGSEADALHNQRAGERTVSTDPGQAGIPESNVNTPPLSTSELSNGVSDGLLAKAMTEEAAPIETVNTVQPEPPRSEGTTEGNSGPFNPATIATDHVDNSGQLGPSESETPSTVEPTNSDASVDPGEIGTEPSETDTISSGSIVDQFQQELAKPASTSEQHVDETEDATVAANEDQDEMGETGNDTIVSPSGLGDSSQHDAPQEGAEASDRSEEDRSPDINALGQDTHSEPFQTTGLDMGGTSTPADLPPTLKTESPDDMSIADEVDSIERQEQEAQKRPETLIVPNPADTLGLTNNNTSSIPLKDKQADDSSQGLASAGESTERPEPTIVPPLPGGHIDSAADVMGTPHMSGSVAEEVEERQASQADASFESEESDGQVPTVSEAVTASDRPGEVDSPTLPTDSDVEEHVDNSMQGVSRVEQVTDNGGEAAPVIPSPQMQPEVPSNISTFPGADRPTQEQMSGSSNVSTFQGASEQPVSPPTEDAAGDSDLRNAA